MGSPFCVVQKLRCFFHSLEINSAVITQSTYDHRTSVSSDPHFERRIAFSFLFQFVVKLHHLYEPPVGT
jgi:hypothetical protein